MNVRDFIAQFGEPDRAFSPAPIWWWSGEPLEIERLRWQMDQLAAMGIWNVIALNMAPSGPLCGTEADSPAFFSEDWWHIFVQVCEHARTIGMKVWFYDQIGFSGANIQANLVAESRAFSGERIESTTVQGTGLLEVSCPTSGRAIAAYAVPTEPAVGSPTYVPIENGAARFNAAMPSRLRLVYALSLGFDYLSAEASARLIDTIHGEFARRVPDYLGATIAGSFQDEMPDMPTWGQSFEESFERAYGYFLREKVHSLFEPGGAPEARVRLDYQRHRAQLAEEAFFKPLWQWHEERGMLCGFDQQSPAREADPSGSVRQYADYMRTHRWYAAPGSDHHGHAKIHSSLAFLYKRPRVWLEGFHSTGWGGTLEETFDWLTPWLRAGANLYNPHAVYYSTRHGWWEWAPPSTCWRQPYARHYSQFADGISRLCRLLAQGVHQADIAVLFPTASRQAHLTLGGEFDPLGKQADDPLLRLIGKMTWYDCHEGELDKCRRDYHLFDEDTLQAASVADAALCLHGVRFRAVVLPGVAAMSVATARQLKAFAEAGGALVLVGEYPSLLVDGDPSEADDLVAWFRQSAGVRRVDGADQVEAALADVPRTIDSPVPTLHRRAGDTHILFVPATSSMATQTSLGTWWYDLIDARQDMSRRREMAEISLPGAPGEVIQWNPFTQESHPVAIRPAGERSAVTVDFAGAQCAVLIWADKASLPASPAVSDAGVKTETTTQELAGLWTIEYVPTVDLTLADSREAKLSQTAWPSTWRVKMLEPLDIRAKPSEPKATVAGKEVMQWGRRIVDPSVAQADYGPYAWKIGPCPIGDLPPAGTPDTFAAEGWEPVEYSLTKGIFKDPIHNESPLGPKGHVPEEFMDFGPFEPGQAVRVAAVVESETDQSLTLAIGSASVKTAWVNGAPEGCEKERYLAFFDVTLKAGLNTLELQFAAVGDWAVRAYWALLEPSEAHLFRRPERVVAAGAPRAGSRLRFRGTFTLSEPLVSGSLQIAQAGVVQVFVDGKRLGRQGGFDPYGHKLRIHPYDLPPLAAGAHEVIVEQVDPGIPSPLAVDLLGTYSSGAELRFMSDSSWAVSRDDAPYTPVAFSLKQEANPRYLHLYSRPHPLLGAAWLEGPQGTVVKNLPVRPLGHDVRRQTFEWIVPPGAQTMQLALQEAHDIALTVGGVSTAVDDVGWVRELGSWRGPRKAVLIVTSSRLAGAVFAAPIWYTFGLGELRLGSWHGQGLEGYSGAIRMTQTFEHNGATGSRVILDLGELRGTVECRLNGKEVGCRVVPPYRFDLSQAIIAGQNTLELLVTNTLGPLLDVCSPTQMVPATQKESGVFGPVTVTWTEGPFTPH